MGIRFEYGSRKATNGPMIFFSDPVSEINLRDEIRGSIDSRLSFYAYRMPGDMMVSFGSSEGTVEGFGQAGFLIAPFLPGGKIITIPYAPAPRVTAQEEYPFPLQSTPYEAYRNEVESIQRFIDGHENEKIVAARVKVETGSVDVASTFLQLTKNYPDAYTFCFSTPQTGCWIGATPELLLQRRGATLSTMALAGTRPAGMSQPWDAKNIMEQRMVTDFIVKCITLAGLSPDIGETVTRRAGNIEHLCTFIESPATSASSEQIGNLIRMLSPTPATAGIPRDIALSIISDTENFERGYYGGFCGPFRNFKEFTLFVNLRCARVESERYAMFAGGGITAYSTPEKEWEETELKLSTLQSFLCNS